ncbi:RNA cap guanine-N2 methyltransferase [Macleaya cordata]|uniref:Trimethylguanosine synthase n=1 Tax=Macleaya cordata TaxID=56857 RepID=A0A200PY43_MACCD|nr:RNA cap guanine-N2 methyltransferase [Macleaya cordata]
MFDYFYSGYHQDTERGERNKSEKDEYEMPRRATSRRRKRKRINQQVETTPKQSMAVVEEGKGTISRLVRKYWLQRYNLFSMYDDGIKMDEEGWFSVTPEEIAIRHAERSGGGTIIDCFSGVGGNSIQFAKTCYHVVAIDIDPKKVALAFNNAKIYGVEDYIDFVIGDFFQLSSSLKADVMFLSPPWGGPTYSTVDQFTLDLLKPKDGYSIFQAAQKITPNIIMFLPRNVDLQQVEELSWLSSPPLNLEVEENYVQGNLKGITAYFGSTAMASTLHQRTNKRTLATYVDYIAYTCSVLGICHSIGRMEPFGAQFPAHLYDCMPVSNTDDDGWSSSLDICLYRNVTESRKSTRYNSKEKGETCVKETPTKIAKLLWPGYFSQLLPCCCSFIELDCSPLLTFNLSIVGGLGTL